MSEPPPTPDDAAPRRLMRRQDRAALGTTLAGEGAGSPYVSLVLTAFDTEAQPLLLLSDLAQHTRNIAADPRVSLLFDDTRSLADPLAGARLSVLGRAAICTDPLARARFVARHPTSAGYAAFADFRLYRVTVERGHLVAGFGRIAWVSGAALRCDGDALAAADEAIVAHMNADHADAVALYARCLLGRDGADWRMTGVDPDGADLRCGDDTARIEFPNPALNPQAVRAELVALAAQARSGLTKPSA